MDLILQSPCTSWLSRFDHQSFTKAAEMFKLVCFLSCVFVFTSMSLSERYVDQDARGFLENILHFYGENNSISSENLDDLLLLISARRSEALNEENSLANLEVHTSTLAHTYMCYICIPFTLHYLHYRVANFKYCIVNDRNILQYYISVTFL